MANWTQDPPERDGWYWVRWPGLSDPSRMTILVRGRRHGRWTKAVDTRGEWLRIPSPDELEAMEEYIAASESLDRLYEVEKAYLAELGATEFANEEAIRKERKAAARSALKKIREGKP